MFQLNFLWVVNCPMQNDTWKALTSNLRGWLCPQLLSRLPLLWHLLDGPPWWKYETQLQLPLRRVVKILSAQCSTEQQTNVECRLLLTEEWWDKNRKAGGSKYAWLLVVKSENIFVCFCLSSSSVPGSSFYRHCSFWLPTVTAALCLHILQVCSYRWPHK